MSVKIKLSLMISLIVFVLLLLNLILNEYSTRVNLRSDVERNMVAISRQVAADVTQNTSENEFVQSVLIDKLSMASYSASQQLPAALEEVTRAQLELVASRVGLSRLSVMQKRGDEYVIVRSTDSREEGTISLSWRQRTLVREDRSDKHYRFWAAQDSPNFSGSAAMLGQETFYTDDGHDYVIRCYLDSERLNDYQKMAHTTSFLEDMKAGNPTILEITGFNPSLFQQGAEIRIPSIIRSKELAERPVPFGTYEYRSLEQDAADVQAALKGKHVFRYTAIHHRAIIKSFILIQQPKPYVIGLVLDKKPLMRLMDEQRSNQLCISAVLLCIVVVCSYGLSNMLLRPVRTILWKVNEVSVGRFDSSIEVKRKDELGQLAQRVNAMSKNLGIYMTKLRAAFEENRSMKEYLESFINHTTDAIHVVDLDGRITQVNRAFEEMFGYTTEEAVGQALPLVPEALKDEEQQTVEQLKSGKPLPARETTRVTKRGERIAVSVTTSPIHDRHGNLRAIASITRDMTSRNEMDELLRRSEKLTTVGQLAAGVAHEIRNPLTTLRGFLQLQQETRKLNERHVDLMLSELDRINLIVGEFLILAKPQATRFEVKDVRFTLGDVISLLDSQAHLCNVIFVTDFGQDDCRISCEENQLKQVFINVLKNAIEAMPQGGEIAVNVRHEDTFVRISITDQGIGIPEEKIAKLGDPFYTDKDAGTGLGIMVSQRIIQSHQGHFEIKSKVNVGTTVLISLPLYKDEPKNPIS
ncbi:PAS domain S-box protein [Paenibacillus sp. MWE-103]|uniref:histidine kinase n=1 Tax=Paenibacillus artemisiicola TaxID=1172618 RepID=A0ABS3WCZ2_9BACL|nr:PAS domain S-box protein [Paenibacillus artemisiicola]MBO7746209.1 PAS domain S-box protein [Paenibacillus artemisiicola]